MITFAENEAEGRVSSVDPRPARTVRRLLDAAAEVAAGGQPLTISAVAKRAGVSRASFYHHFTGLDDLAASLLHATFATISDGFVADGADGSRSIEERARSALEAITHHVAKQKTFYCYVLSQPMSTDQRARSVRLFADHMIDAFHLAREGPGGMSVMFAVRFIAAGVLETLAAWVRGELRGSEASISEQLILAVTPTINALQTRASARVNA